MKVFISADMDGIATTTVFADVTPGDRNYAYHAKHMTDEVIAACEGAIAAGATEIVIKDAHHEANNIDITRLPECAKIIRGWSGHPYFMVQGIDSSFDAVMFVGYHCAAGTLGNPMSHTSTLRAQKAFVNGEPFSEFKLYSWCAALEGVPTVCLCGDATVCREGKQMYPWLETAAVKDGDGASACHVAPAKALKDIREAAYKGLMNLKNAKAQYPEALDVQLVYKEHRLATKASFYPGVTRLDTHTLQFKSDSVMEVARALSFML